MPVQPADRTGLQLVDGLPRLTNPSVDDYCRAAAEYIRHATDLGPKRAKAAQIRLSSTLAKVTLKALRAQGLELRSATAGEHEVGGGLRTVKADVSEITRTDGLTLAVELKPVHLAVGRALWNRFGDMRAFAVNIHLKFPFAVVGGVLTLPTTERVRSNDDSAWKPTSDLLLRAVGRFARAGSRRTEGDAGHLLEAIAVVAFDRLTGCIETDLPAAGTGLRWNDFIEKIAEAYSARFGVV